MYARKWIAPLVVLVVVAAAAEPVLAKRGDRVRERVSLTVASESPLTVRQARLQVERRGLERQMLKIEIKAVERGEDLVVFVENADGSMARIAAMRETRAGVYKWRVRTRKGGALPFGVADVADLSGRRVEVRTSAGAGVGGADVPTIAAGVAEGKKLRVRSGMNVDQSGIPTDGTDDSVDARIEVRRKNRGREVFKIEVDHAASGLTLEAWMEDASGVMTRIGSLRQQIDDDGFEYELEMESDEGGLPFGASGLAELAGRKVEVRGGDGSVLATGTVPVVAAGSGSGSDDDLDDDDSGSGSDDDDDSDDDNSGSGSDDDDDSDDDSSGSGSDDDDDPDDDNSGSGS